MEQNKKYSVFQNLLYCIQATKQGCPKLLPFCLMIILVNCVIPVITTFLPKIVIDEITYGKSLQHLLSVTAVLTLTLAVISGLQKYLDRLIYWNRFKMNAFFLRRITKKGLTTDYRNQENEYFRKLQSESFASCNGNFSYWTQIYDAIVLFFSNSLGFLAFTGILLTLNSWLIVFLMLTTFLSFFLNRRIIKWVDGNTDEKADYEHRMQYIINASNDIQAAKDIRLYNMSVWMNQIYEKNMKGLLGWYRRYTAKLFGVATVDSGLSLVREGVTYLILLYMVFEDEISVADFVLYFNVVAGFSTWLSSLLGQLNNLERLNLSVNRFRSYLEYPEQYLREGGLSVQETKLPQRIELKNVSFQYEENGKEILKNINMVLEPGEHLAVVGLNGAGKTTLVKLICGLLEPTNGSVLYDGIDIRKYNREEFYQLFGAVFQDYSIMPVTIEEIVAEDISNNIDTKKVEDCLKQADIWKKIVSLEAGMKSKYDKTFWDDGINLSGGEIQKLLLARALYRESPIVILDEPTAALDPISENHLYETYDEVMKNKSTVFISHRLASTRFCNRILLIDHGSIIEEGTHEELLSQKGKYYDLFEAQAKYYRENPDGKADTDED
jgi:ATP-binding cassette subfamily B protein